MDGGRENYEEKMLDGSEDIQETAVHSKISFVQTKDVAL